jgi:hypothetical protein
MDEYKEEKISAPPHAVQPVASRYNDYAALAPAYPTDCIPVIHRDMQHDKTVSRFLVVTSIRRTVLPIHTQSSNAWSVVIARAACRFQVSQSERFF